MSETGRASRRLQVLAKPLLAERAPWYVRLPVPPGLERTFRAAGWYWVPPGHNMAVFLGASFETAAHELHTMIEQEVAA